MCVDSRGSAIDSLISRHRGIVNTLIDDDRASRSGPDGVRSDGFRSAANVRSKNKQNEGKRTRGEEKTDTKRKSLFLRGWTTVSRVSSRIRYAPISQLKNSLPAVIHRQLSIRDIDLLGFICAATSR